MKKITMLLLCAISMIFINQDAKAQAFGGKGSKQLLIGLGANHHNGYFGDYASPGLDGWHSASYGALNLQFEMGIHKYIGLGVFVGAEFTTNLDRGWYNGNGYYGNYKNAYSGFAIPVGFFGNFHFLQLIADKTGKNFADKMDVYAGLAIGSGPAFANVKNKYQNTFNSRAGFLLFGGANVGIRFYPTEKLGIFAELGYGKTVATGGICLKM